MINIHSLSKTFGLNPVLRDINLSVPKGGFLALIGPNGAGKTTLLRIVSTLSRPDAGEVSVAGLNLSTHASAIRQLVGVVSHKPLLYVELPAEENLRFYARLYGLVTAEPRISTVLAQVNLSAHRHDLVGTFSRGMQQRLSIARATLHHPQVLILDEPYTGLDQDAAIMLDDVLRSVSTAGCTLLMTTHDSARGLAVSQRVAILSRGQIAFQTGSIRLTPMQLEDKYREIVNA